MPIFDAKLRTVEGYLAGIGASSALLAGALLAFVILVGVATFDSWPGPESLVPGGGDNVTLDATTAGIQQPEPAGAGPPDLSGLLGGAAAVGSPAAGSATGVAVQAPGIRSPGESEPGGGGRGEAPTGGTTPQVPPAGAAQVPPGTPTLTPTPPNVVQQTVSGVGNTVEGTTTVLGDTLGGSTSPGLGGLVGGLGQSLNSTLQSLAGTQ
jgi:hypothetical protein